MKVQNSTAIKNLTFIFNSLSEISVKSITGYVWFPLVKGEARGYFPYRYAYMYYWGGSCMGLIGACSKMGIYIPEGIQNITQVV